MDFQEHIKQVEQWLTENVQVFATPAVVTLSEFEIDSGSYSGSFHGKLDGVRAPERFRFRLGKNGKPSLHPPKFHSPLGAPASYRAVELTEPTSVAILSLLTSVLPKMKPLGLNRETGELVVHRAPSKSDRIVRKGEYAATMERISRSDFSISCNVGLS